MKIILISKVYKYIITIKTNKMTIDSNHRYDPDMAAKTTQELERDRIQRIIDRVGIERVASAFMAVEGIMCASATGLGKKPEYNQPDNNQQ